MLSCDNSAVCHTDLYECYPFLMRYFFNGINNPNKNLAHCILFYGSNLRVQYDMALEIARILNCTETHTRDCQCLNCKWIRDNKHPAVLTISKVDNKPETDTSKTVISIEQARMIKNNLLVTSNYHRVFIFCDKDNNGNITGLNETNFQEPAANALLKTFEEPPPKTTFFFLTKDKSDLISTVISRAQCFFVPSLKADTRDCNLVCDAMNGYLELERNEVLDLNDKILELTKENDVMTVFIQIQNYIEKVLENNISNISLRMKLLHDLKAVETAKRQLTLNMNIQTITENLAFELIFK